MKVALVNLAKLEDISESEYQEMTIRFMKDYGIEYLDFYSGRSTLDELVDGFHQALKSDAELIWFCRGGVKTIKALEKIDWKIFAESKKMFMGSSDPTHIAWKAHQYGLDFFYGPNAQKIYKYFPSQKDHEFVVKFIKTGEILNPPIERIFDSSGINIDLQNDKITGGHTFITSYMAHMIDKMHIEDKVLFLEHHNSMGEGLDELLYYFDQLKLLMKNISGLPKAILLGHSFLFNQDGKPIDWRDINKSIIEEYKELEIDIFQIDSVNAIIPFRA